MRTVTIPVETLIILINSTGAKRARLNPFRHYPRCQRQLAELEAAVKQANEILEAAAADNTEEESGPVV